MEPDLFNLNFKKLQDYPDKFDIKNRYEKEIPCHGFCTCCENKLQQQAAIPPLMSHGCSTEEIKQIIPEPFTGTNDRRIMFLLENPGGDYQNGCNIKCNEVEKNSPVNHFYFSPNLDSGKWPITVEEVKPNPYGNYFAYLIKRHSLNNVYITNCIKCKYTGNMYKDTKKICVDTYLKKEIEYFDPQKIVVFGCKAMSVVRSYCNFDSNNICGLWHPAARRSLNFIIEHNDEILAEFLRKI